MRNKRFPWTGWTEKRTQEPDKVELDFTNRGNGHTDDDQGNIGELLEVGWCETEDPSSEKGGDGIGSLRSASARMLCLFGAVSYFIGDAHLKHLDKRNAQVDVSDIAEDQAHAEHNANRDNGTPGMEISVSSSVESCYDDDYTYMYVCGVIGTLCLESRWVVVRARTCVMKAAKSMCHVVKKRAVARRLVSTDVRFL